MATVWLVLEDESSDKLRFGAELLGAALSESGCQVVVGQGADPATPTEQPGTTIVLSCRGEGGMVRALEEQEALCYYTDDVPPEGFAVQRLRADLIVVVGADASGALYGCQELARLVEETGSLPDSLDVVDGPTFALRGPAIGLQKTHIEPPRSTYDYPITPERFPWFYDRAAWLDFLDGLLEQRANVVYLWTGHPFASLVKLAKYPEALEVSESDHAANVETLDWLVAEAGRRGIRIVLNFYNIHLSLPFAQKRELTIHQSKPSPVVSDYYIESLAAFVQRFPDVGLMICLGEALQAKLFGEEWLTETLLRGVNIGRRDLPDDRRDREPPPIIIRSHAVDATTVLPAAKKLYPTVYTEAKYNGESLTTDTPHGHWKQRHRDLAAMADVHIINVHILANLEPFRWGAPSFVQRCMQAAVHRLGARGLHLYPLCFWDWPVSPDKVTPRLLQFERDWIWYEAWLRYAWNPERDRRSERRYWSARLSARYGSEEAGPLILDAYERIGECAPRILPRFGITEGNRQTLSLGMTLAQLVDPGSFMAWKDLWESQSSRGERLEEYVSNDEDGVPHVGETPPEVLAYVEGGTRVAADRITAAAVLITCNDDEFDRLRDDVDAISLMVRFYSAKVRAAMNVLRYKKRKARAGERGAAPIALLEEADALMKESVAHYGELAALTDRTYLYANSMQTAQRRIPFDDGAAYKHWASCLPAYQDEYERFHNRVLELKAGRAAVAEPKTRAIEPYVAASCRWHGRGVETYEIVKDSRVFTDSDLFVVKVAEELVGLTGLRFSQAEAADAGVTVDIELDEPSRVLVGYFASEESLWLQAPNLEEDAHADDRGGLAPVLVNAIEVYACPALNVHAYAFDRGRHTLAFGKGAYLIVGVIAGTDELVARDANEAPTNEDAMAQLLG